MEIKALSKLILPKSTDTQESYYESIYTVTGSLQEIGDFQMYVENYKPKLEESKMEIVDFSNKELSEIPEQDNPVFGDEECLMLVKNNRTSEVVIYHVIPRTGLMNPVAITWKKEIADIICKAITKMPSKR